jgi:regulator of sirC expression with transglutaminase-like and TPR domain
VRAESDPAELFSELARREEPDLLEGSLLISRLIDPATDEQAARDDVERLADRLRAACAAGDTAEEAIARVLFREEGFAGDAEDYDNPENSSVASVLARRRGMPITLSIVVVEVGRRAGLDLAGVGLPGHFVVSGRDLPPGFYLDPFDGGALCDEEALNRRVSSIFGSRVDLPPEAFAPDGARAILVRVLLNLRRAWERRERFDDAMTALSWAEALDPGEPAYGRERGLLLLKAGRTQEALSTLEEYLSAGSGEDAEAVRKLVDIVREQTASGGEQDFLPTVPAERKIFSLEQARQLLPQVQELTSDAVFRYARLGDAEDARSERESVVRDWAKSVVALGAEIKGLWLVDFDSGGGYYCWKYPEPALEFFHGYDEGFAGRLPLQ